MLRYLNRVLPVAVGTALLTFSAVFAEAAPVATAMKVKPKAALPLVIGHRGASGYRPEHTLAAYELAIDMGADFVEPDLVSTKDGVLVARHENEISGTTDVAARPEFAHLQKTKTIDGAPITGWFTEDFTLAQLKTLRAKERIPQLRPGNTAYDGQFEVPTLQEVIDLVARKNRELSQLKGKAKTNRRIGIYPETKHPTYFDSIDLSMEEPLVKTLHRNGYRTKKDLVFIQSFEVANLKDLNRMTNVRIAQLINSSGKPYDFVVSGDARTYADLVTPAGLAEIAKYADGIGANKALIIPRDGSNNQLPPTTLIRDAHAAGLDVHAWTFRSENFFLPTEYRNGVNPVDKGNAQAEYHDFYALGLDGVFSDHPDDAVAARNTFFD